MYDRLEAAGAFAASVIVACLATALITGSARILGIWHPPIVPLAVGLAVASHFALAAFVSEGVTPVGYQEVKDKYEATVRRRLRAKRLPTSGRAAIRASAFLVVKSAMSGWVITCLLAWLLGPDLREHLVPMVWATMFMLEFAVHLIGWLWRARFPTFSLSLRQQRDYMVREIRRFEPFWYPSYWEQPVS